MYDMANKKLITHGSEHILDCLKKAHDAVLKEQGRYRDIIDRAEEYKTSKATKEKLLSGRWKAFLEIMQDCSYPPDDEDRKKHLHLEPGQTLFYKKLDKINDKLIRSMTQYLNGVVEQTQRLRSMAMYLERIGNFDALELMPYYIWVMRATELSLYNEAVELGMDERAESAMQYINITDKAADLVLFDKCEGIEPGKEII